MKVLLCLVVLAFVDVKANVSEDQLRANRISAVSNCGLGSRTAVLSFDDGPVYGATRKLKAFLEELDVKASFFLTPHAWAGGDMNQCQFVRELKQNGHSIHSHTKVHADLSTLPMDEAIREIGWTNNWIHETCRITEFTRDESLIWRPPFGRFDLEQAIQLRDRQPNNTIFMWNVETNDHQKSQMHTFEQVKNRFLRDVGMGNSVVILFHDVIFPANQELMREIVQYFRDNGYTFVTADECVRMCKENESSCFVSGPTNYEHVFTPSTTER